MAKFGFSTSICILSDCIRLAKRTLIVVGPHIAVVSFIGLLLKIGDLLLQQVVIVCPSL